MAETQAKPPPPPTIAITQGKPPGPRKVNLKIGGKERGKFLVPQNVDLTTIWTTFKQQHNMSDEPHTTWPRDFVQDMMNYHACTPLGEKDETETDVELAFNS